MHRDFATTLVYADYTPSEREAEWVEEAFAAFDPGAPGSKPNPLPSSRA